VSSQNPITENLHYSDTQNSISLNLVWKAERTLAFTTPFLEVFLIFQLFRQTDDEMDSLPREHKFEDKKIENINI
jgi:hypothetical protein